MIFVKLSELCCLYRISLRRRLFLLSVNIEGLALILILLICSVRRRGLLFLLIFFLVFIEIEQGASELLMITFFLLIFILLGPAT